MPRRSEHDPKRRSGPGRCWQACQEPARLGRCRASLPTAPCQKASGGRSDDRRDPGEERTTMTDSEADPYGDDIYTEPDGDPDTLANLGPLTPMAGVWRGLEGADAHPVAEGTGRDNFHEHYELQPIDPQTNGPQLFYGLRYHTHIVKPGEVETYHDQVGYWLWEPATGNLIQTVAIPRGQTAMAFGQAARNATSFELVATRGATTNGICSNPFLEYAFQTVEYRIKVTINPDHTWEYDEDTTLRVRGQSQPFHHTDHSVLSKTGEPTPNPLARG